MTDSTPVCLNCGTSLSGKFCYDCGQKVIEPNERTIKHFFVQFLGSAFFLENNFIKNLWTLVIRPGQLTSDFIAGKRKRWMPPISIFLLINLFYFWFTPLSDLKLRLQEQLRQPQHAQLASYLVDKKMKSENMSMDELEDRYNAKRSSYANTLIMIHIPIFAGFMALLFIRKKLFFTDHFIYGLHFCSVVLLLALIQAGIINFLDWLSLLGKLFWNVPSYLLLFLIIWYVYSSIKKVYHQKTLAAIFLIVPVIASFIITHFIYRTIIFLIIYWSI